MTVATKPIKRIGVSAADAKRLLQAHAGMAGKKVTPEQVAEFPAHLQKNLPNFVARSCDRYLNPRPSRN
jgi:hypothetical protein